MHNSVGWTRVYPCAQKEPLTMIPAILVMRLSQRVQREHSTLFHT